MERNVEETFNEKIYELVCAIDVINKMMRKYGGNIFLTISDELIEVKSLLTWDGYDSLKREANLHIDKLEKSVKALNNSEEIIGSIDFNKIKPAIGSLEMFIMEIKLAFCD
ncbi:gp383 [Bacillus phage G]|uniref:Gp383 n=1 Tax=Bacillus phage G TaxID=2884420 RepID=G3MAC4_9CAUD|nr:gp383 [Bacillus phage G]AEO93642.1 gp383 [Bacillus phage G]